MKTRHVDDKKADLDMVAGPPPDKRVWAANICRELAIPENAQVINVLVWALDTWRNGHTGAEPVASVSPLKGFFTDGNGVVRCSKCGWPRSQMIEDCHSPCIAPGDLAKGASVSPEPPRCGEIFQDGPVQKTCWRTRGHGGKHAPYLDQPIVREASPVSTKPEPLMSAREFWKSLPLLCPENAERANFVFAESYAKYVAAQSISAKTPQESELLSKLAKNAKIVQDRLIRDNDETLGRPHADSVVYLQGIIENLERLAGAQQAGSADTK